MKETTLLFNGQITADTLRKAVAVEKDIAAAVRELGYDPDKQSLTIEVIAIDRYAVRFGRKSYVGIWDGLRKTFVD